MKFLLEFVACCGISPLATRQPEEDAKMLVQQEPRRRLERKTSGSDHGSWRPSLSSITENVIIAEEIKNPKRQAEGSHRTTKRKAAAASPRERSRSSNHDDYRRDEKLEPLSWELRVQIALDVARGLEYLHDGAVPSVTHRDIKSSNILLDESMRARVADFGLSREEMVSKKVSNIQGTFGYLDPEYISTRSFPKRSDVYSYGVLLFELIAARNPLQGLMEYVELAAMNTDGIVGWEEIIDPGLDGKVDVEELNEVAALAHKCVKNVAKKRPTMRDIVQELLKIHKSRRIRLHRRDSSTPRAADSVIVNMEQLETPQPNS